MSCSFNPIIFPLRVWFIHFNLSFLLGSLAVTLALTVRRIFSRNAHATRKSLERWTQRRPRLRADPVSVHWPTLAQVDHMPRWILLGFPRSQIFQFAPASASFLSTLESSRIHQREGSSSHVWRSQTSVTIWPNRLKSSWFAKSELFQEVDHILRPSDCSLICGSWSNRSLFKRHNGFHDGAQVRLLRNNDGKSAQKQLKNNPRWGFKCSETSFTTTSFAPGGEAPWHKYTTLVDCPLSAVVT